MMKTIWTVSLKGNVASRRQVLAVACALRHLLENTGNPDIKVVSFTPESPDGQYITDNRTVTWATPLSAGELLNVRCEDNMMIGPPWPDFLISCRPETAAIAIGIRRASRGKTKVVHIQSPNWSHVPPVFDTDEFDVIVTQPKNPLSGGNVIQSQFALHDITPGRLQAFRDAHRFSMRGFISRRPLLSCVIGGGDEQVPSWPMTTYRSIAGQIAQVAQVFHGSIALVTARRTDPDGKTEIRRALHSYKNVFPVDDKRLPYEAALSLSAGFMFTPESLSVLSEMLATNKPLVAFDLPVLRRHSVFRTVRAMNGKGMVKIFDGHMQLSRPRCPFSDLQNITGKVASLLLSAPP